MTPLAPKLTKSLSRCGTADNNDEVHEFPSNKNNPVAIPMNLKLTLSNQPELFS